MFSQAFRERRVPRSVLVALRRAVHVALPVAVVLVAEALAAVRAQEAVLRALSAHLRAVVWVSAARAREWEPAPVAHLASLRMPRAVWSARQQLVLVLATADASLAALARLVPHVKLRVSSVRQDSTSPRLVQAIVCLARLANIKTRSAH